MIPLRFGETKYAMFLTHIYSHYRWTHYECLESMPTSQMRGIIMAISSTCIISNKVLAEKLNWKYWQTFSKTQMYDLSADCPFREHLSSLLKCMIWHHKVKVLLFAKTFFFVFFTVKLLDLELSTLCSLIPMFRW